MRRRQGAHGRRRPRLVVVVVVAAVVLLAGCEGWQPWAATRADSANTGNNTVESHLDATTIATVQPLFEGPAGQTFFNTFGSWSTPTVSDGRVFVANSVWSELYSFAVNPGETCSGTPVSCPPVWTASVGQRYVIEVVVRGGIAFVTANGTGPDGRILMAFDASGTQNCSGTPTVCQPLWTSPHGGYVTPTVANGIVYLVDETEARLVALDAAGVQNCGGSPKVCQPLWTSATVQPSRLSTPAVGAGSVFLTDTNGGLVAFDAAGSVGCSGVPKVCNPRWSVPATQPVVLNERFSPAAPVVSGGRVFVNARYQTSNRLTAYDATGQGCTTYYPQTCTPLWSTTLDGDFKFSQMAVTPAGVFVHVGVPDSSASRIEVFDPTGAGCSGVPQTCSPLWSTPSGAGDFRFPSVANGLLYQDTVNGMAVIDANGQLGCSGQPKVCAPLHILPFRGTPIGNVAISGGKVFALTGVPRSGAPVDLFLEVLG